MVRRILDEVSPREGSSVKYILFWKMLGIKQAATLSWIGTFIVLLIGKALLRLHDADITDHIAALEFGMLFGVFVWMHLLFLGWLISFGKENE